MSVPSDNIFLQQLNRPETAKAEPSQNIFLNQLQGQPISQPKEGLGKSLARGAIQLPLGAAERYTWPLNLLQLLSEGEALAGFEELEERIPELQKKFPQAPWENFKKLDKEKYLQGIQAAASLFPTQQNLEKFVEEKTGLPLTPQTRGQELTRLGSTAAAFRPGGITQKLVAGGAAPTVSKGLEVAGVPRPVADVVGLGTSGAIPTFKSSEVVKPGGMTERKFENVKKDIKVSPTRSEKIHEALEKDFRGIADKILSENKTYSAMKNDNLFKEKIGDLFQDVEKLSKKLPGQLHTQDLRDAFRKRYTSRKTTGISDNEFESSFRKEIKKLNKTIPHMQAEPSQYVEQFRKNNQSLTELYEPGKSSAQNRGKKEALLEYNRSIEDVFNKNFPDSEFNKLFKFTNNRWKDINDIEKANDYLEKTFSGKINYSHAKKILNRDQESFTRPFKRLLGDEKFKEFKSVVNDLMTTQEAMKHIKIAESQGFKNLSKLALTYLIHPKLAATKLTIDLGKEGLKFLLDKPKIIRRWRTSLDEIKAGNYGAAQKSLQELDKEFNEKN